MGEGVVLAEAKDVAGTEAGDVAVAIQRYQFIVADFLEGDAVNGVAIGDAGGEGFFLMGMDLLALRGRFRQHQVFEVV